jgi:hypothetical protein
VAVAALAAGVVLAIDDAELQIEAIQGDGWRVEDMSVRFALEREAVQGAVTIGRMQMDMLARELREVRIDCPRLETSVEAFACRDARVAADWPELGVQTFAASVRYGRSSGALTLELRDVRLGGGSGELALAIAGGDWRASVELNEVPVALLMKLAAAGGAPEPTFSADAGVATAFVRAHGSRKTLQAASVAGGVSGLTLNNESGSIATDQLVAQFSGQVLRSSSGWTYSVDLSSRQGQAYVQPIFADLAAHSLRLGVHGVIDGRRVTAETFSFDHEGVAQADGAFVLALGAERALESLDVQLRTLQFPGAYASYFQPLLLDTSFKSMSTAGRASGRAVIAEGELRLIDLTLDDLTLDDGACNLVLAGLNGRVRWRGDEANPVEPSDSVLRVASGALLGLDVGPNELRFSAAGREVRLLRPTRIPLLDGAVAVNRLHIRNAATPDVEFEIDAAVEPISVERLSRAFGWPEFGGSIGGEVSQLRMQEGVVTLGTTLQAQVFDGAVRISDLELEQPFGQWPRFNASIELENLDLELLTQAFSFGRITGRLSGAVLGLELFNWTPVSFDARLYTPAGDRSRHRISQRAVESIGSIGGGRAGVTAALSSGVLRFFDDFNYDRLGVSCRLENEVCYMDGVAPAPQGGYYLVKGRGLPRIDVIGGAHRVDWPRLVRQLVAATESAGPMVE